MEGLNLKYKVNLDSKNSSNQYNEEEENKVINIKPIIAVNTDNFNTNEYIVVWLIKNESIYELTFQIFHNYTKKNYLIFLSIISTIIHKMLL